MLLDGGFVSLAAARTLAKYGVKVCAFGAPRAVSRVSRSVHRYIPWPGPIQGEAFSNYLTEMADEHRMRGWVLFPFSDNHLQYLAQHGDALRSHYVVTTPTWEAVRALYDKRLTCTLAERAGVSMPQTVVPGGVEALDGLPMEFPVVVKPAMPPGLLRATKKKAFRAENPEELREAFEIMASAVGPSEVMVQELIPSPGKNLYSYAGYFEHGEPLAGLAVKRSRQFPIEFGMTSTLVESIDRPELETLAARVLRAADFTGLAEVEFMWNEGRARFELLEVNARLWAWHGLAPAAGIDLSYLAYRAALGESLSVGSPRTGVKWIRSGDDFKAAWAGIRAGSLTVGGYVRSLRGRKTFSTFSVADPLPFVVEQCLYPLIRLRRRIGRIYRTS